MYTYIKEQAHVLPDILAKRAEIGKQFSEAFRQADYKRLIIVASGSSYHAAVSARYFIERTLKVEVQIKNPFPFTHYETQFGEDALVIGVSQSGRSTATIESMQKAEERGLVHAAVSASPASDFVQNSKYPVIVPCGDEKVGYVTLGYTSTILTLQLMVLECALQTGRIEKDSYDAHIRDFEHALRHVDDSIAAAEAWYENNREAFLQAERALIVGYGPNFGTALEGALKVNETVRFAANGYEFEEFLHGPFLELNEKSYVFLISSEGAGEERMDRLQAFLRTVTQHVYKIGHGEQNPAEPRDMAIQAGESEWVSPLEYVIPFQVLAHRLSADHNIDVHTEKFPTFNEYVNFKKE